MRVGSLFSGIGGLDLGLERAGMEIVWQVEVDEWCRQVLARHFPDAVRYGDVRECGAHNLSAVDLICGGPPCQPVSHAGQRRGAADDRYLWPEMLRIVGEVRPRLVLAENPTAFIYHNEGALFADNAAALEALGYEVAAPLVLPACAFGAPHRRDRVFIIAHLDSARRPEQKRQREEVGRGQEPARNGAPQPLADANCQWELEQEGRLAELGRWPGDGHWWPPEPAVARVVHGAAATVDRARREAGLGNAVVPQCAEYIGRAIVNADRPQPCRDADCIEHQCEVGP